MSVMSRLVNMFDTKVRVLFIHVCQKYNTRRVSDFK